MHAAQICSGFSGCFLIPGGALNPGGDGAVTDLDDGRVDDADEVDFKPGGFIPGGGNIDADFKPGGPGAGLDGGLLILSTVSLFSLVDVIADGGGGGGSIGTVVVLLVLKFSSSAMSIFIILKKLDISSSLH